MHFLSRPEEMLMLAILRLRDNAYCVSIRETVSELTEKEWSFGAIYVPLHRLEKKHYVESYMGDPTPERGGRSKRFYKITALGMKALKETKKAEKRLWEGLPEFM